jgi:biotin transport system permease protein
VNRYEPPTVRGYGSIHEMDPRAKIVAAAALSIITLKAAPGLLGFVSLGIAATTVGARLTFGRLYRSSKPALPFVGVIFLLHAFFSDGDPLFHLALGPLKLTTPGLVEGGLLAWRFTLLLFAGSLLTLTTSQPELTSGLERLLRPICRRGVSSQDLALMVSLALRFVPTLQEEMESLKEAQASRGAGFDAGGLYGRARAMCALALPLSLALFRRCDYLVEAMHARGYDGGSRTGLKSDLTLATSDGVVIVMSLAAGVGCFFL